MNTLIKTKNTAYIISSTKVPAPNVLSTIVEWLRIKTDAQLVDLRVESHKNLNDSQRILFCVDSLDATFAIANDLKKQGMEPIILRLGREEKTNKKNVFFCSMPPNLSWSSKFALFQTLSRMWRESHARPRPAHAERSTRLPWEK